jgi:MEMO1 family protein
MSSLVRESAFAGQFYPGRPDRLRRDVDQYTAHLGPKVRAVGCVAPHAGYMYSGYVAGAVYARIELPQRFVILCPNHTGMGQPLAIMNSGAWSTPLGDVGIDEALAESLQQTCDLLVDDPTAHAMEHALEVQLPFLQVLAPGFQFVPIAVGTGNFDALTSVGDSLADVISGMGTRVLVIASSDMNHYENDSATRIKDAKAIERVLSLDPGGLYETVRKENISMCGYGPAVIMLTAAKKLGARFAELVKYATSGDVSGERDAVVGYAGMLVR